MLASFSKGNGYSKNYLLPSGTPIILYGRLYTKYETNITIVDTFVAAKSGSVYSRGGEVIVPASGETAEDISIASVVENKGVILGGDLNIITPDKDLNSTFLALTISFGNAHKELSRFAQGKSVVHLHNADLKNADISYPEGKEQQKIGQFFQSLDRLITLHQREYFFTRTRKNLKPTSKKTNAWEQRKLGSIVERVTRKNTNNESTLPLTISAQYGLVDQITYFNNRVASRDVSNYFLVKNGEFAYNKSSSDGFPFGAIKRLDLYPMGVLSTLYIVFSITDKEKTESDFLTVFFDTNRWHRGVAERAAEGARNHGLLNISADDFLDISLFLPKENKEQQKIGQFVNALNHLITLHQREQIFDEL